MIIKGITKYFKSLSVGGGIESTIKGALTGSFARKTTLVYAKDLVFNSNKILEIDATVDFSISMETKLLDTPAENQVVYTNGALRQPKTITIKCYLELDKLSQLREIHREIIPVWVICEKPIPSTINQKGYYADSNIYAVQSISIVNEGYDNCVACTFVLREIQTFEYRSEYLYNVKNNKINKNSSNRIKAVSTEEAKGNTLKTLFSYFFEEDKKLLDLHNLRGGR